MLRNELHVFVWKELWKKGEVAVAYVMVSPLSDTTKLLRVKNDRISPAI